ncbi:MAG: YCF48-related protein [bacterium]
MKLFYSLFIFLLLVGNVFSQGWEWLNPRPTGNNLNDVFFINNYGWIAGEAGTIYHSSDSGLTWNEIGIDTFLNFNTVFFVDSMMGWVAGESGAVFRTEDAGTTWVSQNSGENVELHQAYFYDSLLGYMSGDAARIIKTTDGGSSWTRKLQGNFNLYALWHINSQVGWAAGWNGAMVKTTDGWEDWNYLTSGLHNQIRSLFFTDASHGWYCTEDQYFARTGDGGSTWHIDSAINQYISLSSVFFTSQDSGWMVGSYYGGSVVMATASGGVSWNTTIDYYLHDPRDLFFWDNLTGLMVGEYGSIYRTTDAAITWDSISSYNPMNSNSITDIFFTDSLTGWLTNWGVYKTTDGGSTWDLCLDPWDDGYYSLHFTDSLHGCAVGVPGFPDGFRAIQVTTDGGNNWTNTISWPDFYSVYFTDFNHGWAAGNQIVKSTDGGFNWSVQYDNSQVLFRSIFFVDSLVGWAVGYNNIMVYTTDGGANWIEKFNGGPLNFQKVTFADENNGWIVGEQGVVLSTTDGGDNWLLYPIGYNVDFYDVAFADIDNGWIVGDEGLVLHTTDGGSTWIRQYSRTRNILYAVCFINPAKGWIAGEGTSILTTGDGGGSGIEEPVDVTLPNLSINQSWSYPNPFAREVTISFNLPLSTAVEMEVYNVNGQKIINFPGREFSQGIHQLTWNGHDQSGQVVPAGIYFYRLLNNSDQNVIATGRIIKLQAVR